MTWPGSLIEYMLGLELGLSSASFATTKNCESPPAQAPIT